MRKTNCKDSVLGEVMNLQKTIIIIFLILASASTVIANQRERSFSSKNPFVDSTVSNYGNSCQTKRVNLTHTNLQSEGDRFVNSLRGHQFTDDGRYLVFESWATDLVPDDTNDSPDIFVRDLQEQTTERVSVMSDGSEVESSSVRPSISDNGRFVTFVGPPTLTGYQGPISNKQVLLHDMLTKQITLISKTSNGEPVGAINFPQSSLSSDGNIIAFYSSAKDIIASNGEQQIFVYNRQLDEFVIASASSSGELGNERSFNPVVSANGRYVLFSSIADNLVPNDTNDSFDVFVHDLQTSVTKLISINSDGEQGNQDSGFSQWRQDISDDGRYAVFVSEATNFIPENVANFQRVYVHDLQTSETSLASPYNSSNSPVFADDPAISGNGRYVTFRTSNGFIIPDNNDSIIDIYVKDLETESLYLASRNSNCEKANAHAEYPFIAGDGGAVIFSSEANNLVANDTNENYDFFINYFTLADPVLGGDSCPSAFCIFLPSILK